MKKHRIVVALAVVALVTHVAMSAWADVTSHGVTELGDFGGEWSNAWGVTNDGVVVGDATNGGAQSHAYRWSAASGMVDLGTLGGSYSYAYGVSSNGAVVVGQAYLAGDTITHAFRWTQAGGMTDLGTLGGAQAVAQAISMDGSVIVGDAYLAGDSNYHTFRWTQANGMIDLGTLGGTDSTALGTSSDGSVIVGDSYIAGDTTYHAFRWTQANGMIDLGTLGGTNSGSGGYSLLNDFVGTSSDGSVVVGSSQIAGDAAYHAFRWTQAGGMIDLGTIPGGTNSYAEAVSATGQVIVGNGDNHAFRWTQSTGTQDLNTILTNAGVNMTGIDLNYAYGISPNGKYIVGEGTFPSSSYMAYLVCYDPDSGCVGLTTGASQASSVNSLAASQRGSMIGGRTTANMLLGMDRPVTHNRYGYTEASFGSALGAVGGQWNAGKVTVLGGVAYGSQESSNVRRSNAPTLAAALRYSFDDPFGDTAQALHPYVELGGWVTPRETLSFTRRYANGSGIDTAHGSTSATSWAEYGKAGLAWDITPEDQLNGWAELGQQYMNFNGYAEDAGNNPFPASVGGGLSRMAVTRAGLAYTRKLDNVVKAATGTAWPVEVTLAGAAAHSFNVHSGLTANVQGVGATRAADESDTWGEFGARLGASLTHDLTLNVSLDGTTGGGNSGTRLHAGAGISYAF